MRHKNIWFLSCLLVLGMTSFIRADDPTSRFFPLSPLASSLPARTGLAVRFELWDQATAGTMVYSENHSVDTGRDSTITNDTGQADLLLGGRCTPQPCTGGLTPGTFPAASSRYLDVTQRGLSVLAARVPLYASVFSVSAPNEIPGNLTLVNSTQAVGNILKDGALFLHNFGNKNTFLGQNAGNLAMDPITAAFTAIGFNSLHSNVSGNGNTGIGYLALQNNNSGFYNTAIGFNVLAANNTGSGDTASGESALSFNTSGGSNTATGATALYSNTTGFNNTATGAGALFHNCSSPCEKAGSNNTATGVAALSNNTTGNSNTASGVNALQSNTTGNWNAAIGALADVSSGNLTNATAIGFGAVVNASNKIRLGNAAVTLIEASGRFSCFRTGEWDYLEEPRRNNLRAAEHRQRRNTRHDSCGVSLSVRQSGPQGNQERRLHGLKLFRVGMPSYSGTMGSVARGPFLPLSGTTTWRRLATTRWT